MFIFCHCTQLFNSKLCYHAHMHTYICTYMYVFVHMHSHDELIDWYCFVYVHIVLFAIFIPTDAIRKSYHESIQLDCPNCDSNECPISINGVNTTTMAGSAKYTIQNNQLILPPDDWDSYGRICCGTTGQQSCYTVCPQPTGKYYIS